MHGTLDPDEKPARSTPAGHGPVDTERGTLLSGLVIDGHGVEMSPSRVTNSGVAAARYYVGTLALPGRDAPERIPAARLDANVVAILARIRLLGPTWQRQDITAIIRRAVVLEDAIILQLDKRRCLTAWRAQEPMLQRIATSDVLRLIATCLTGREEITEAGTALCLKLPRHARARKTRNPRKALLFQRAP